MRYYAKVEMEVYYDTDLKDKNEIEEAICGEISFGLENINIPDYDSIIVTVEDSEK